MVAVGIVGGLSVVVMRIIDNVSTAQIGIDSKASEIELVSSIRMALDDDKHCKVSLQNLTFKKSDIDEDGEGLDISLFLADQTGTVKVNKLFNGENNPGTTDKSKFDNLKIKSLKLLANNGTGANYADSASHSDIGTVRAVISKRISSSKRRDITKDFMVRLQLSTGQSPDPSGESRIISCRREFSPSGTVPTCTGKAVLAADSSGELHCYKYKNYSVHVSLNQAHLTDPNYSCTDLVTDGKTYRKCIVKQFFSATEEVHSCALTNVVKDTVNNTISSYKKIDDTGLSCMLFSDQIWASIQHEKQTNYHFLYYNYFKCSYRCLVRDL